MSGSDLGFILGVAHGITKKLQGSWSDLVARVPRLLVPIQLDVLVVREEGRSWADCAMTRPPDPPPPDPDESPAPPIDARSLLPPPFDNREEARPRGAYLHWALPDALTRGKLAPESYEASFPAIPNRWLVLRLAPSKFRGKRTVRGWVLRAGDRNPSPIELDDWRETGDEPRPSVEALNALGYGHAGWSAYFDNVENRLAFYDDLSGVREGPLAYLVCGWYSKPELDPLSSAHVRSLTDFGTRMAELRWEVPDDQLSQAAERVRRDSAIASKTGLSSKVPATPLGSFGIFQERLQPRKDEWWPNQILCHGAVVGIGWPRVGWAGQEDGLLPHENGGPPSASSVKVAIGNTTAEAMAALLVQAGRPADEGRVLEAFQLGMLMELDEPDGRARVDAGLHASTFGSMPGGDVDDRVYEPPVSGPSAGPVRTTPPPRGVFERNFRTGGRASAPATRGTARTTQGAQILTQRDTGAPSFNEAQVVTGGLFEVNERMFAELAPQARPGGWVDIIRPLPRFYHPVDPVILVQGARRSFRHGGDGRFTINGMLQCRLTDATVKDVGIVNGEVQLASGSVRAENALDRGVDNGSVPPDCEDLLRETCILDPGSAEALIRSSRSPRVPPPNDAAVAGDARRVMVEQTVWWTLRDARVDPARIVARSGLGGVLPSPLAITPPFTPWCPLHLDWKARFVPSPERDAAWKLEEVDYNEVAGQVPGPGQDPAGIEIEGRSGLTASLGSVLASAVRRALEEAARSGSGGKAPAKNAIVKHQSETSEKLMGRYKKTKQPTPEDENGSRTALLDIAETLENMDVLNGVLEDFHLALRGGIAGDGQTTASAIPDPFISLRAGFLRIVRLRLVDGFGQFLDLLGSSEIGEADASRAVTAPPMVVTGRRDLQALPPRFTSPARLWLRYLKGQPESATDLVEARLATDRTPAVSPVCGYLMANHLDSALEFFGDDGSNRGMVRPDLDGRVVWEDAPGTPITVGQSPARAMANPFLPRMAQAILDWGIADGDSPTPRESVLSALMRVIDTTLWTVDPFAHQGDEHLCLLVGHPVAVMRAQLRLEVLEPVTRDLVNQSAVPVRLGALTHWQDGVLGYFVNDDYRTLYVPDPVSADQAREAGAMRGFLGPANQTQSYFNGFARTRNPVRHPYVNRDGFFLVRPNQDVLLTLLVEPHARVTATAGLVPRKEIGMQREWTQDALSKLAPTFRFGPVLIDPKRVRMPVATELNGTWSWDHRSDVNTWASDPVTHATQEALLPADPPEGSEGWLRLTPKSAEGSES